MFSLQYCKKYKFIKKNEISLYILLFFLQHKTSKFYWKACSTEKKNITKRYCFEKTRKDVNISRQREDYYLNY